MAGIGESAVSFSDKSWMIGDLLLFQEDQNTIRMFLDFELFTDEALWDGVAIRIEMDIALDVYHPVEALIDGGDVRRQGQQIGFLHEVSLLWTHAQTALGIGIGDRFTPVPPWRDWLRSCQSVKERSARKFPSA
jgi:hypothetical protein